MSQLREQLQAGKFVVTGEIGPPKGTNIGPVAFSRRRYGDANVRRRPATTVAVPATAKRSAGALPRPTGLIS